MFNKIIYSFLTIIFLFSCATFKPDIKKAVDPELVFITYNQDHDIKFPMSFSQEGYWLIYLVYDGYIHCYHSDFGMNKIIYDHKISNQYQQAWLLFNHKISDLRPRILYAYIKLYHKIPRLQGNNPFYDALLRRNDLTTIYLQAGFPLMIKEQEIRQRINEQEHVFGREITLFYKDKSYTLLIAHDLSCSYLKYCKPSSVKISYPLPPWFYQKFPDLVYAKPVAQSFKKLSWLARKTGSLTLLTSEQFEVLHEKETQIILKMMKIEESLKEKATFEKEEELETYKQKLNIIQNILYYKHIRKFHPENKEIMKTYWYQCRYGKNGQSYTVGPFLNKEDCLFNITENRKSFEKYYTEPYFTRSNWTP